MQPETAAPEAAPPINVGVPDYSDRASNAGIERNFTYCPPLPTQPPRYNAMRSDAMKLALLVNRCCPPSRERSLALTKLEEAIMWANAAIARNEVGQEKTPGRIAQPGVDARGPAEGKPETTGTC